MVKINSIKICLTYSGPENVKNFYNGFSQSNELEFDNRWNNVTQKSGYKSTLGNQGLRVLDSMKGPPSRGLGYQATPSNQPQRDRYAESRGLAPPSYNSSSLRRN